MDALKLAVVYAVIFSVLAAGMRYVFEGNLDSFFWGRSALIGAGLGLYRHWRSTQARPMPPQD